LIRRVRLVGWMGFDEFSVEFRDGVNFVYGGNFAGKTSLVWGLVYGVSGMVPEPWGVLRGCRRVGAGGETVVEVDFDVGGVGYRVKRVLTGVRRVSESAFLYRLDGEGLVELAAGRRSVKGRLEEVLGFGLELLVRAGYVGEGSVYSFMLKPPRRGVREEVERLLGVQRASEILRFLRGEERRLKREFDDLRRAVGEYISADERAQIARRLSEIDGEIEKVTEEIRRVEAQIRIKEEIDKVRGEIEGRRERLRRLQRDWGVTTLDDLQRLGVRVEEEIRGLRDELQEVEGKVSALRAEHSILKGDVEKLRGAMGAAAPKCPVCERPLSVDELERIVGVKEYRMKEVESLVKDLEGKMGRISDRIRREEERLGGVRRAEDEMKRVLEDLRVLNGRLTGLLEGYSGEDLEDLKSRLEDLKGQRDELVEEKGKLKGILESASGVSREEVVRAAHRLYFARFMVEALEKTIEEVGRERGRELDDLVEDVWRSLSLRSHVRVAVDSDLRPSVELDSGVLGFGQMSASEKITLYLATRLAFLRLAGGLRFLVLDDPVEHLDEVRVKALYDVVDRAVREGWVDQVIMTSYSAVDGYPGWNVIEL